MVPKANARKPVMEFFESLVDEWADCPDPDDCPHHAGWTHTTEEADRLTTTLLSSLTDNGFTIAVEADY